MRVWAPHSSYGRISRALLSVVSFIEAMSHICRVSDQAVSLSARYATVAILPDGSQQQQQMLASTSICACLLCLKDRGSWMDERGMRAEWPPAGLPLSACASACLIMMSHLHSSLHQPLGHSLALTDCRRRPSSPPCCSCSRPGSSSRRSCYTMASLSIQRGECRRGSLHLPTAA
jgi:hypothetical protein